MPSTCSALRAVGRVSRNSVLYQCTTNRRSASWQHAVPSVSNILKIKSFIRKIVGHHAKFTFLLYFGTSNPRFPHRSRATLRVCKARPAFICVIGQRARLLMEYCPDEVHMEEEEVQVQVQAEEEETGETHEREQGEEKRERKTIKSHTWMTMRMRRSVHQHLSCAV